MPAVFCDWSCGLCSALAAACRVLSLLLPSNMRSHGGVGKWLFQGVLPLMSGGPDLFTTALQSTIRKQFDLWGFFTWNGGFLNWSAYSRTKETPSKRTQNHQAIQNHVRRGFFCYFETPLSLFSSCHAMFFTPTTLIQSCSEFSWVQRYFPVHLWKLQVCVKLA